MLIGTLEAVRRYPVKSLSAEELDCARVLSEGVAGDRTQAFFVRAGHARVGKTYRGKEHERLHLIGDAQAARAAAAERGTEVELRGAERFFDDAPISLLVDCWLDDLSANLGYRVEWERFRPNFFVRASEGFVALEQALTGAELRLGGVKLRVRSPIERCVVTTYHPQGAPSDPRILEFVARQRNAMMGIYCDVVEPGIACVGDLLTREAPLGDASLPPTPG